MPTVTTGAPNTYMVMWKYNCEPLWPASRLQTKSKIMQCLPNNITNNNELYESVDHSNFLTTNMNYSWGVILETYRYCWLKNATTSHVRTFLFTTSQSHDRFHSEVHFYRKFCAGKIWNIFTSIDTGSSLTSSSLLIEKGIKQWSFSCLDFFPSFY